MIAILEDEGTPQTLVCGRHWIIAYNTSIQQQQENPQKGKGFAGGPHRLFLSPISSDLFLWVLVCVRVHCHYC